MKNPMKLRALRMGAGVAVVAVLVGALWMLERPAVPSTTAGGAMTANQEQAVGRIASTFGMAKNSIRPSGERAKVTGDLVVAWPGGEAHVEDDTGLIRFVYRAADEGSRIGAPPADKALQSLAAETTNGLGWGDANLAREGFRVVEAAVQQQGDYIVYHKRWARYSPAGIDTGGFLDLTLNAVTGDLMTLFSVGGSQAPAVESQPAISQEKALAIASATLENSSTEVPLEIRSIVLTYNASPALTGGVLRLLYVVELLGNDDLGLYVGGKVVIDAMTGEVVTVFPVS